MAHVTVIGAGIVGVCCARYLQRDGHQVTVVDRVAPGQSTSFGNAGIICGPDACVPLPGPGTLRDVPRMLTDRTAPLVIRWRYLPRFAPWLIAFLGSANETRQKANARAFAALLDGTLAAYETIVEDSDAAELVKKRGTFTVYDTEAGIAADARERALVAELGGRLDVIGPDELRQMEPALTPALAGAAFHPDAGSTIDPGGLTARLGADVAAGGGRIVEAEITDIRLAGGAPEALVTSAGELPVEVLVVAGGAWSARLAKMMGGRVLLDTERGYHRQYHGIDTGLTRPLVHGERHFGLAQMSAGLRFAGTVEFAGVDAPPDYERAANVYRMGQDMIPGFEPDAATEVTEWMGRRPTMPDYLPVLGPAPGLERCFYAFGHQHLGLSLGARSGQVIADCVAGRDPGLDLAPFRADRF